MIRLWLLVAITARWYDHHGFHALDHLDEIIGIICLVGNHHLRIQTLDQGGSLDRNLDRRSEWNVMDCLRHQPLNESWWSIHHASERWPEALLFLHLHHADELQ